MTIAQNYSEFKVHDYYCWYCGNKLELARIQNENFGSFECNFHKNCTLTYAAVVDKLLPASLHATYLDIDNDAWISIYSKYKTNPILYLENFKIELNNNFLNQSIEEMIDKIKIILLFK